MMRVIKLGGSLLQGDSLISCLNKIAGLSGGKFIVPGGGVFAEQIRLMQDIYQFDDIAAHHMAVLAMQQMAILLNSVKPEFMLNEGLDQFDKASGNFIWFPQLSALNSAGIPASWDVTSDSLSAWLAKQLKADSLVLVKSARINRFSSISDLQQQGIVDAAFLSFTDQLGCPITIIDKDEFIADYV
jgi:aspartokinase-like uncharacterized kinase